MTKLITVSAVIAINAVIVYGLARLCWPILCRVAASLTSTRRPSSQPTTRDIRSAEYSPDGLYVVRLYDGMDGAWYDITGPVTREEAERIWNKRTCSGTSEISYENDIDYYRIFPANTKMFYNVDNMRNR
jgi:hypothetical protein